jgi:hypothetical protein
MTVTDEAVGLRLRGEPSSRATRAEVGILLYRAVVQMLEIGARKRSGA